MLLHARQENDTAWKISGNPSPIGPVSPVCHFLVSSRSPRACRAPANGRRYVPGDRVQDSGVVFDAELVRHGEQHCVRGEHRLVSGELVGDLVRFPGVRLPNRDRTPSSSPIWSSSPRWTNAPSTPRSSAACASSTVCSSESAALRVCDPATSRQCPNERNPIFFTSWISAADPARIPGPSATYRPSPSLRTPAINAFHSMEAKRRTAPSGSLLSLTSMRAPCEATTSRQLPLP